MLIEAKKGITLNTIEKKWGEKWAKFMSDWTYRMV